MKKIKVYLPLFFVFIVTITGLSFDVIIPNIYGIDYNDQVSDQKNNLWQLGKNLSVGDSYTYKICDLYAIPNYSAESYHYFTKNLEHNSSLCYVVKLDFVNFLSSDENQINSHVWVVQASISDFSGIDSSSIRHSVFHVDSDSFEVRSSDTIHPDTIRYAQSLENTIFSIFKYTASEPKLLQKNVKWGEVTEYLDYNQNNPDMKVLQDDLEFHTIQNIIDYSQNQITSLDKTFDVYKVGYEIDIIDHDPKEEDTNNITNSYLISSELPFPLSGTLYSPAHITEPFKESEFQLISFVSSNRIIEEEKQIVIEPDNTIVEEDNIISSDKIIVEEIVEDNVIEGIIEETIDEEIKIEEKEIVIPVKPIIMEEHIEEIIEEPISDEETSNLNSSLDKSVVLVIFLTVVIGGVFVYYKKFRNPNNNPKSVLKNNNSVFNKIIHFDDKVAIKIKEKQD
ncbi:hypothetical protein [Nitrosopumilus sp.]|uniref:hypothetical protein n=1 Tax=Nitrosopumilus sp. TaxID=2024843 RepID=UPI002931EBCD|nr:hypothetical protein [Nitrosopumilus sp.]